MYLEQKYTHLRRHLANYGCLQKSLSVLVTALDQQSMSPLASTLARGCRQRAQMRSAPLCQFQPPRPVLSPRWAHEGQERLWHGVQYVGPTPRPRNHVRHPE